MHPHPARTLAVALVVGATVLVGCGGPRALDPEPPLLLPDSVIPPDPPVSTIGVPLEIPVGMLADLLEDAVPRSLGTLDSMRQVPRDGRTHVSIALERSGFDVQIHGADASIQTTIGYALEVAYDLPALPDVGGSCGTGESPRPRLRVAIRSPVSIGRDWRLETRARLGDLRAASDGERDRCEVTLFGVDVTDDVVAASTEFMESHLEAVDSSAAQVDTRSRFEAWWGKLREPIRLDDSLWLAIGPEAIRRGPVQGSGDTVRVELALSARPRVIYGPRPRGRLAPLPPLDTGSVAPRLDLLVDARADYAAISDFLTDHLGGTVLELADRRLIVRTLRVYGVGAGRLALELGLAGDVVGRLYLVGTPSIDSVSGSISIPDLEFDDATRKELFPFLPELTALPLRDFLRAKAVWPSEPAIEWLTRWLAIGLNRYLSDELGITGIVDDMRIVAAYARRDALLVRISARGRASVFLIE
ncbi:MAG: DUF4403 family protein [Gemmatimonadales bacterium]